MAKTPTHTPQDVQAMHEWYMASRGRTLSDVARHFGVGEKGNATNVSSLFRRHGLPAKSKGAHVIPAAPAGEAAQDPYPTVLSHVGQVLSWGCTADNIGGGEPEILGAVLQAVRDVLAARDPASLPLVG